MVAISVAGSHLIRCFTLLNKLIPNGSKNIPINIKVETDSVKIFAIQKCYYEAKIPVIEKANTTLDCTVLYSNVTSLLSKDSTVTMEIEPFGIILKTTEATITLPTGYSVIQEFSLDEPKNITESSIGWAGFQTLLKAYSDINSLYKFEKPIFCYGDSAAIYYPNIVVKARTPGLNIQGAFSIDHVKLLCALQPKSYALQETALTVSDNYVTMQVPCKSVCDTDNVASLLDKMKFMTTMDLTGYADKIRSLITINKQCTCSIALSDGSLKTTVRISSAELSLARGNFTISKHAFTLPIQLWFLALKAFSTNNVQVLFGDEILCMRTRDLIMLIHVLS